MKYTFEELLQMGLSKSTDIIDKMTFEERQEVMGEYRKKIEKAKEALEIAERISAKVDMYRARREKSDN